MGIPRVTLTGQYGRRPFLAFRLFIALKKLEATQSAQTGVPLCEVQEIFQNFVNAVSRKIEKKQNFMMIEDYYLMRRIIRCRAKQTTDSPKFYCVVEWYTTFKTLF